MTTTDRRPITAELHQAIVDHLCDISTAVDRRHDAAAPESAQHLRHAELLRVVAALAADLSVDAAARALATGCSETAAAEAVNLARSTLKSRIDGQAKRRAEQAPDPTNAPTVRHMPPRDQRAVVRVLEAIARADLPTGQGGPAT